MLKTFCLVLLIGLCASNDTSSLLHRLFGKRSRSSPPVILILDKNTLRPLVDQRNSHTSFDSSEETETLQHLIQHLSKSQRSKSHSHSHSRTHQLSAHHASRDRNLQEHEDKTRNQDREENKIDELVSPKSVLRSPIYRSLLTLRNRLQCGARDECQNDCSDKLKGSKKEKCQNKCEKKFECEEEKPKDNRECGNSCEDSDEPAKNSCEQNQCQGSTKGVLFDPEPVGCKRC